MASLLCPECDHPLTEQWRPITFHLGAQSTLAGRVAFLPTGLVVNYPLAPADATVFATDNLVFDQQMKNPTFLLHSAARTKSEGIK